MNSSIFIIIFFHFFFLNNFYCLRERLIFFLGRQGEDSLNDGGWPSNIKSDKRYTMIIKYLKWIFNCLFLLPILLKLALLLSQGRFFEGEVYGNGPSDQILGSDDLNSLILLTSSSHSRFFGSKKSSLLINFWEFLFIIDLWRGHLPWRRSSPRLEGIIITRLGGFRWLLGLLRVEIRDEVLLGWLFWGFFVRFVAQELN